MFKISSRYVYIFIAALHLSERLLLSQENAALLLAASYTVLAFIRK